MSDLVRLIRSLTFEFFEVDGVRQYQPLSSKFSEALPDKTADEIMELYPLPFCCPLFVASQTHKATDIVNEILKARDAVPLPTAPGVYFLCDAIDAVAYINRWTPDKLADMVEEIERQFKAAKLDGRGHKPNHPRYGR